MGDNLMKIHYLNMDEEMLYGEINNPDSWDTPNWHKIEFPSTEIAQEMARRWNSYEQLQSALAEAQSKVEAIEAERNKLGEYIKVLKGWDYYPADLHDYIDEQLEIHKIVADVEKSTSEHPGAGQ